MHTDVVDDRHKKEQTPRISIFSLRFLFRFFFLYFLLSTSPHNHLTLAAVLSLFEILVVVVFAIVLDDFEFLVLRCWYKIKTRFLKPNRTEPYIQQMFKRLFHNSPGYLLLAVGERRDN